MFYVRFYERFLQCFFFFKQKTAYEIMPSLVGSEMCIRDRYGTAVRKRKARHRHDDVMVEFPCACVVSSKAKVDEANDRFRYGVRNDRDESFRPEREEGQGEAVVAREHAELSRSSHPFYYLTALRGAS